HVDPAQRPPGGPARLRVAGDGQDRRLYYLFGSELSGWATNDNQYATAPTPAGPWSDWRDFAPPGSATFDSQISTVVPVARDGREAFVFVGDRWIPEKLGDSAPVWLPMHIGDGDAEVLWREEWTLADLFEHVR